MQFAGENPMIAVKIEGDKKRYGNQREHSQTDCLHPSNTEIKIEPADSCAQGKSRKRHERIHQKQNRLIVEIPCPFQSIQALNLLG